MAKLDAKRAQSVPGALPAGSQNRMSFMGSVMPSLSTGRVEAGVKSSQERTYKGWKNHQEGLAAHEIEALAKNTTLHAAVEQERIEARAKDRFS